MYSLSYQKNQVLKINITFRESSYNGIKVVGNFKTQDDDRPPCWNFIYPTHSLNHGKSNTDENKTKYGYTSGKRMLVIY